MPRLLQIPFKRRSKTVLTRTFCSISTTLRSLRTHYRGQVVTDSLNQGLNDLPEVPVATENGSTTKYVIIPPAQTHIDERVGAQRG
jgi:hypothetical protein